MSIDSQSLHPQLLNLPSREIRVSATGGIRSSDFAPAVSISNRFAEQIGDRYTHPIQCWTQPEQTLRRSGAILNAVHHDHSTHLTSRLSLTILHWRSSPTPASQADHPIAPIQINSSAKAIPTTNMRSAIAIHQTQLTFRRIVQPEKLVEEIQTRQDRLEKTVVTRSIISRRSNSAAFPPQDTFILETPLIVVKAAPKAIQQSTPESTSFRSAVSLSEQEALMPPRVGQPQLFGKPSQSLDGIDVNRLTDQVVQAIDRRLIAHRERMGRI